MRTRQVVMAPRNTAMELSIFECNFLDCFCFFLIPAQQCLRHRTTHLGQRRIRKRRSLCRSHLRSCALRWMVRRCFIRWREVWLACCIRRCEPSGIVVLLWWVICCSTSGCYFVKLILMCINILLLLKHASKGQFIAFIGGALNSFC
jgi:hypothetical protein